MLMFCSILFAALTGIATTRNLEEREVRLAVEQFVNAKLASLDGTKETFSIEFRSVPRRILDIPRHATLRVVDDVRKELRNNVMLPVEVVSNGRVGHVFFVTVKIRRFGDVLVAPETIEKNRHGDSLTVEEAHVETTSLPADLMTDRTKLLGKRAKRIITKGSVLTESMFEPLPTVFQGSPVTLILKVNGVLITTSAVVREDGLTGDFVLVQKAGAGDRFKARVLDGHTVELITQH
jgi:flagella basal body P-ring formation protein FlgA